MNDHGHLLAFYGDDITGSTDAMDALSRAGIETVLFLDPPERSMVKREFGDAQAVGVAGTSRSMTPAEMDEALPSVFEQLAKLPVPIVHYKVCSTFDSAPEIGSIGRAIDAAADAFETESVPVVPAAPALGRYVVFGNMFAADEDGVYRLDRHPTMSEHPVTPMDESDLCRHLAEQTDRSMGLVDVLGLQADPEASLADVREDDPSIVFFDTLNEDQQATVGRLVWEEYAEATESTAFAVGSSGFEYAMTEYWATAGIADETPAFETLDPVDRLLVVSGSASPVTKTQIETALAAGFTGVRIDTAAVVDPATDDERERVRDEVLSALRSGDSVVAYTALGPGDDAVAETKARADELTDAPQDVGRYIGRQQGELLRELLEAEPLDRVCVAGGDTCGYVTPHLDVYALRSRFPLAPGSPICTAHATTERFDGLEIALKSGQLGGPNFFVRSRDGASEWV
ncbi:four-carbon acid sugar kinase family protein [Haloprofundus salilacus]|uniref:four-carbon acid sugar kinase family protein n=1 Tax=Haloprofundus salilacus TaxID=2876190 RepID=UPI001CCBDF19|nr:four-carbon acid sugar kinase family protein [Haloprofundus salilacus]